MRSKDDSMLKTSRKKYLYSLVLFFILSIFSVILFAKLNFSILYNTGDIQYHMRRIMDLKEAMSHGQLFPIYSFNYLHGSAMMGMYPYLSLYPFIFITLVVHSVIKSYYIFVALITFVSFLTSFFSSISYNKSFDTSLIFSMIYGLSPVLSFTLFTSGDLGIATSLSFLPLVIFGFLDIMKYSSHYVEFILGIILMAYCQIASVIIVSLFLVAWLLINIRYVTKHIINIFIKSFILIVLSTSFIWVTFCYMLIINDIHTVVMPYAIIPMSIKFFIKNIGVLSILSVVITPFFFNKLSKINKQMYVLSIIIIIISSKLIPWELISHVFIFHIFHVFQFTYRFLIVPQLLLSYLLAIVIVKIINNIGFSKIIISLLIGIVALCQLGSQFMIVHKKMANNPVRFTKYYSVKNSKYYYLSNNKSVKYMINGYFNQSSGNGSDYYPKDALSKRMVISKNKASYENKLLSIRHIGYNQFSFNSPKRINRLALPLLHYNREHLRVYVNNHLVHCRTNGNSLITLSDVNKGEHQIKIKYVPNVWLVVLRIVMSVGGILWILLICYKSHKKKFVKNVIKLKGIKK